jgi:glycosyltransferase involved in cell wall biosynthesis
VPPDDPNALATAIRHILDNPDLAKRLGEASLEIGRRHAEEETFDAYEKLYRAYSQKIPARC